jgi:hypothetical protein
MNWVAHSAYFGTWTYNSPRILEKVRQTFFLFPFSDNRVRGMELSALGIKVGGECLMRSRSPPPVALHDNSLY